MTQFARLALVMSCRAGQYYACEEWPGQAGWLCPATLHYFPDGYPEHVWLQVLAGPSGE